jgi:ABC-type phosphate/phosphonate transport system substrate-binding protein
MSGDALVMGAVAYDPKVVTIWDGFRTWFRDHGLELDYVLYSNYERQVDDLLSRRIDAAWNSPLAWIRAQRAGAAAGTPIEALTMRDSDRDLTSVVVARADSGIDALHDLAGKVVATGAIDSPQSTLIPLSYLRANGLVPGRDFDVHRFDIGVGLHGDHIGGERDAARALVAGEVDAACMIDGNHLAFGAEGTLPTGATTVIGQTDRFDHCNMTVRSDGPSQPLTRFNELLLGMSYGDAEVRPLLDLEGLKAWADGRTSGYGLLDRAVSETGFYDDEGRIGDADYRP